MSSRAWMVWINRSMSPCLAKGPSAGRFVGLGLAYSAGAGLEPDMACRFSLDEGDGSRRDSVIACPHALAASVLSVFRKGGSLLIFLFFCFGSHSALVGFGLSYPWAIQPIWPACWLDCPYRSSCCKVCAVQDFWDVCRQALELAPADLVSGLRGAGDRFDVDAFWTA